MGFGGRKKTARAATRPARRGKAHKLLRRALKALASAVGLLMLLSIVATLLLRWVPPLRTGVMMERRIAALIDGRQYRARYIWVPMERISPHAAIAVVAAEDQKFADHHGFDVESIQDALDDSERGERLRGASTISQQVAKNVFLWSGRSFVRKGLEAWFTALVELLWSKRRILEVYLNIVELGDGVFGVEAASQIYFRKPAARLQPSEAALLAAVLPNPHRLRAAKPSIYVQGRRDWILGQMEQLGGTDYLRRIR
ncbi:MAG: monofunctional biosynthetic peptidoglycan transglycosylase [Vicinamibacterales bacterium]